MKFQRIFLFSLLQICFTTVLSTVVYNPIMIENVFAKFAANLRKDIERQQRIVNENFKRNISLFSPRANEEIAQQFRMKMDWRLPHIMKVSPIEPHKMGQVESLASIFLAILAAFMGPLVSEPYEIELGKKYNKFQKEMPQSMPFPCDVSEGRSVVKPSSVRQIRAGDIDLVAQFGDSVLAGNGVAATSVPQFLIANAGLSFGGGGQAEWRKFLTIPNILKEYNPNLIGYATREKSYFGNSEKNSYDFTVPASRTADLLSMAQAFVKKARDDPRVDFNNDWKMITVLIGGIDMCQEFCYFKAPWQSGKYHKRMLETAFDYLLHNSPRTIVLFVTLPNIARVFENTSDSSPFCKWSLSVLCPCRFAPAFHENRDNYVLLLDEISLVQREMANNPKYQNKQDFAIIELPIWQESQIFTKLTHSGYTVDYTAFAPDCFHLSQKGHAIMAARSWNFLVNRSTPMTEKVFEDLICPTKENPYLAIESSKYPH